ncbi:MAG TPA: flavoprotein [Gemmatales bacterium]|nr:flavoprotein [Gemmatales bacterium]
MAKVLLGVTGSVAALKTPELVVALTQAGHELKVVATQPALYFFDRQEVSKGVLHTDDDEWPKKTEGYLWKRTDPVLHIELRRWADIFLIAPLDANTLAKLAGGICDNCLTCVWRAWDLARPVLLAPAMNTLMWEHPQTAWHLQTIARLFKLDCQNDFDADGLVKWINKQNHQSLRLVGPIEKTLACGDVGQGAMADVSTIVDAVAAFFSGKR